ncbi:MAG: GIY-YIG nuclease family protein [Candidatus Pacebacteria bacterium]|nr:GIY-YIG nuclease family protein [Candidatus Paceibacterota bacterium]
MKNFGVYILKSTKNNRYYVGSTDNIERRVKEHNLGRVTSTKLMIPWELKAFIQCESVSKSRANEFRLKKYKRRDILEKVIIDGVFPWEY